MLLEGRDPRALFAGGFDLSRKRQYAFADGHIACSSTDLLAIFFDGRDLATLVFDLLLDFTQLIYRIFWKIDASVESFESAASQISLYPRIPDLQRGFDRFGLQFPLCNTLLEFFDLVLLILAMGSQFAPSSASDRKLFEFISKLFAFCDHPSHLPNIGRRRYDLSSRGLELSHDIDERNSVEATR